MRRRNVFNLPEEPKKGPPLLVDLFLLVVAPPISTFIALYLLYKRGKYEFDRQRLAEYRRIAAIIGDRSSVSIREIAMRVDKSPEEVADVIQQMLDRGIIDPRAFIDRNSMILYMDDSVVETDFADTTVNIYANFGSDAGASTVETHFVETENPQPGRADDKPKAGARRRAKPEAESKETETPASSKAPKHAAKPAADTDDFEAKLREIRQLNDEIDDDLVSERIDRIGALTASIFRTVREKPEQADEVRKFMNYYLPTTMKLLKSYSLMEKQSYQGENIQASRKKIEDVLDTLVHAFERQQDKLFSADALDVDTDISVLETMMASDGLTKQSGGLHL